MKHLFSDREFNAKVKKLAVPFVLQNLLLNAVSLGDTLMLGWLNQESLASVSLAGQVAFFMSIFISALTHGATVLAAQYLGRREEKTAHDVFCSILRYALLVSVIFSVLTAFIPEKIMRVFTTAPEMIEIGAAYLRIASLSYLFSGISQCYLCLLKVNDRAKAGTMITTGIVLLDLVLNAIFIFGLLGVPAMGVKGAALTTVISKGLELLLVMGYAHRSKGVKPTMKGMLHIRKLLEKEFWFYTWPIFINGLAWGGSVVVYSMIMGHLGTDATAAYSMVTVVKNLIVSLSLGMCSAAGILLGKELGDNQLERAKEYGARLSRISILFGFLSAAVVLAASPALFALFTVNEATHTYLWWMLVITAVHVIGRNVNDVVIVGIFTAGGDTKFDAQSLVVAVWCVIIPIALCAAFWWKLPVLWVFFILSMDEIIKLPWVYLHYKKYLWVRNITKDELAC